MYNSSMIRKTMIVLAAAHTLTACTNMPKDVLLGTPECAHIGCATGDVQVFPHERWGATQQPRRWYGWEWGESSSAHAPGTPEYVQARAQECARARTHGLDCQGRSLYDQ